MVKKEAISEVNYNTLTTRRLVEELLKGEEHLRGDDVYLVSNVWSNLIQMAMEDTTPQETIDRFTDMISDWYKLVNLFNLPSYDTITRIRRDVQRKCPELRPKETIRKLRKQKQERIENDLRHAKDRAETNAWLKQGENKKHE